MPWLMTINTLPYYNLPSLSPLEVWLANDLVHRAGLTDNMSSDASSSREFCVLYKRQEQSICAQ